MFVVASVAAVVATVPALAFSARRLPRPVWLYTLGTLAMVIGSGGLMEDRLRLLLAAFPLLIALGVWIARANRRTTIVATGVLVLCGLWIGAYSLSGWRYAI